MPDNINVMYWFLPAMLLFFLGIIRCVSCSDRVVKKIDLFNAGVFSCLFVIIGGWLIYIMEQCSDDPSCNYSPWKAFTLLYWQVFDSLQRDSRCCTVGNPSLREVTVGDDITVGDVVSTQPPKYDEISLPPPYQSIT